MRLILAATILLAAVAADARGKPKSALGQPDCRNASAGQVKTQRGAGPQRLDQLPDAQLIRAVDYREGGCSKPILVNRTTAR
ncbi:MULTISPECIES: hypothetical protein [Sphingomonas]|uniref:hypothetical protein n=1 Tax=Sphingomonas TaxID=13687 RepID=UPI00082E1D6D|nr:hypothetical protein [Sphingomonas sp. CCH10-B3]